jgi:Ca-activated chloride channel family protein
MSMKRSATPLFLLFASACASQGASESADNSGGGGVSFGGQQDIGEFRGILESGAIPGRDTLDANGFFNEHFAPPPATGCTSPICLTPGVSVGRDWLTGAHQATLQVAVSTNVDPATVTRKPLNLVVVVDHSGSMWDDQRLEKVKVGLHTLVDNLGEGDRLALVQFDDRVDVLSELGSDKAKLHTIINGLTPRGSTNIYDGLDKGFQLASNAFDIEHQNRVIFLSDGLATAGDTNQTNIIAMADRYVTDGIGLTTIGVGLDFDVNLMRGLAEHGAGNFYFLEDATAASEVFAQELDYFVTPLAVDVHVSATSGAGWTMGETIGSTLWSNGEMKIPAVFVASRTSQGSEGGRRGGGSMLFIHLTPTGNNIDGKVADIKLTYRLPGSSEVLTQNVTLAYPNDPSETPEQPYLSAPEMSERYAMYNVFLGLRFATRTYSPSCAAAALRATRENAVAWQAGHNDPDIAADITLIDRYIENLGATTEQGLDACGATDPYTDDPYGNDGYYEGGYGDDTVGCSAGGNSRGLLPIAVAAVLGLRRRRRTR